jgi:hypothetical protein
VRLDNLRRRLLLAAVGFTVTSLAVVGVVVFMTTRSTFGKILPPTGFSAAHLESLPLRQINTRPNSATRTGSTSSGKKDATWALGLVSTSV